MPKLLLINKPFQVLSQFTTHDGKATLSDFIDTREYPDFYPAGRLDYDSEGLLLLTDSGSLQHRIAHPSTKMEKVYWVQVEGSVTATSLLPLERGVILKDGKCKPAKCRLLKTPDLWPRTPPYSISRQANNELVGDSH